MNSRLWLLTLVLIIFFATDAAASSPRTALVIGNSSYQVSPLRNPINDATDMAKTLNRSGFNVSLEINADLRTMITAIREFGRQIKEENGVGLFYYAGHGVQVRGRNYLIPLSAVIESEGDVQFEAVDAGFVLSKMEDAGNDMNIVILDACRNNPFARTFRSGTQGLARMDAPKGSIIAYATAPGQLAADGTGRNGIYTKHLIQNIQAPHLKLEDVFKNVRRAVVMETANKQVPWESSSLMGQFYFSPPKPSPPPQQAPAGTASLEKQAEILYWDSIKNSTDPAMFEAFLVQFPDGIFANLATIKLTQLARVGQLAMAAEKDPVSTTTPKTQPPKKTAPPQKVKPLKPQKPTAETAAADTSFAPPPAPPKVSEKKQPAPTHKNNPQTGSTKSAASSKTKTEPVENKPKPPVKTDMLAALDVKAQKPEMDLPAVTKKKTDSFQTLAVFPFKPVRSYWNRFVLNGVENFYLQNKQLKLIASFYDKDLSATHQAINQGKEKPFLIIDDNQYNFDTIWVSKGFGFGRAEPDIPVISEIGKKLEADFVLTGVISASGADPTAGKISLFLIDVSRQKIVSETYSSSDMERDTFLVSNTLIEKLFAKVTPL